MLKILIVDDDASVRFAISENLKESGFVPVEASNGADAVDIFQKERPDSVILDLKMPGMDGMETMRAIKKIDHDVPVIINTAHGDVPTAVEAIKQGAYDFIMKPPDFDRLIITLKRASENFELSRKVKRLDHEIASSLEYMLGSSDKIKRVIEQIKQVSNTNFSLLLQGETGTGKSFIARIIHSLSNRSGGPFIHVDIGAIPETLIESELFGHDKGAFTGAEKKKTGFFEMADKGTLLIDELQNLSPHVQSKLLMAVEEKIICPVGSSKPVKTDVRIIGATNADIHKSPAEKNRLREDLFFRLSEFMVKIPPLRERIDDIPFFADKFFREVSEELGKRMRSISDDAMDALKKYSWPGNIRELKNLIRRAVLISDTDSVQSSHLQFLTSHAGEFTGMEIIPALNELPDLSMAEIEKAAIRKVLEIMKGNKSRAASVLKIDYSTLLRKIKQYGI